MSSSSSAAYRAMKYQELLQEFLYTHGGVLTPAKIAQKNEIEKHFVDFKLNILAAKGYQLPVLPELHNDRLCLCEKYFRFFVIIQNNNYVLEIQSILYVYHIIFM